MRIGGISRSPRCARRGTLVFVRRIVGPTGKRGFATDSFEASLLTLLDDAQRRWLDDLLRRDPVLDSAFARYTPRSIDLAANLGFGLPDDVAFGHFGARCDDLLAERIEAGLSIGEVLALVERSDLEQYSGVLPQTATLQLVAPDHLRRGDDFVFTRFDTFEA